MRPAPGPISVTSPNRSVVKVMALVAPPTEASGCVMGKRVGFTLAMMRFSISSTRPISFQRSPAAFAAAMSSGVSG